MKSIPFAPASSTPSRPASRARRAASANDCTTDWISGTVILVAGKPLIGSARSLELQAGQRCTPVIIRSRPAKTSWTTYLQSSSWTRRPSSRQKGIVSSESMYA